MILACDQHEDNIRLAWLEESGKVEVAEYQEQEGALRHLEKFKDKIARVVLAQGASLSQAVVQVVPLVAQVSRLEAVYWGLLEKIADGDCLILSVGQRQCSGGVVRNGQLFNERRDANLGMLSLYTEWLDNVPNLKRALESSLPSSSSGGGEPPGFREVLQTTRRKEPPPFPVFGATLNFAKAAGPHILLWKRQVQAFLRQLDPTQEVKTLICTDWTAVGSLAEVFQDEYQIIYSTGDPLYDAARGMLLLGQEERTTPKRLTSPPQSQQIRETEQTARELLTQERYDAALFHLVSLCKEAPENETFRLLRRLTEQLQETKQQLSHRSQELEQTKSQVSSRLTEIEEERDRQEKTVTTLNGKVTTRGRIVAVVTVLAVLGCVWVLTLFAGLRAAKDDLESQRQENSALKEDIREKDQRLALAGNKTEKEKSGSSRQAGSLTVEVNRQVKQISLLQETLNERERKIRVLEGALSEAQAGETGDWTLKEHIAVLQKSVGEKEAQIDALERQAREAAKAQDAAEQALRNKEAELTRLRQQLLARAERLPTPARYVVVVPNALLRLGPSEYSDTVEELNVGTKVRVERIEGDWLWVASQRENPSGYLFHDAAVPVRDNCSSC